MCPANPRTPEDLRRALAHAGVPVFVPGVRAALPADELAQLVADLVTAGDPRLVAAVPCILVAHARSSSDIVSRALERLDEAGAARLGLLNRCARALAISRAPDLEHVLGDASVPGAASAEPADLPDPDEDMGERLLAVSREDEALALVGDAESTFDVWLRQLELDSLATSDA